MVKRFETSVGMSSSARSIDGRGRTASMTRRLIMILITLGFASGCTPIPSVLRYETQTIEQTVMAWTDAYNRDEVKQLRLLVHPSRIGHFDVDQSSLRQKMKTWRIDSFVVGNQVVVNDEFPGRKVALEYHNGSRPQSRTGVFVYAKERWWVWSY